MFSKMSFEQLARFYGALTELESLYGKTAVMDAIKEMSDRLDQEVKPKITYDVKMADLMEIPEMDPVIFQPGEMVHVIDQEAGIDIEIPAGQIKMDLPFEPDPEEDQPEKRKKRKPKRTRQRIQAEAIAKDHGQTIEEFLVDRYYKQGMKQEAIGDLLGVNQTSISSWIREIPQKTIKRLVGGSNEQ
jgi:hypothetical protein